MHQRKIIFRADAGPAIGMGHFIRTLALAEMLKEDFYCVYASRVLTDYQISEIKKVCHEYIELPEDDTHFNCFLNLLAGNEIVVLDNYYFCTDYQQLIKSKGCKLVCIDDMHEKHFVADVIINHAEGINKSQYSAEKYTEYCLGLKFALLRKDYLTHVPNETQKQYACLVIMGGSDPFNLTEKIVSMIEFMQFLLPVAVVVGNGKNIDSKLKKFDNIELFKGIESKSVFKLMLESHVGVLPASTVAIEACAARLPFVCGFYIENQKKIYAGIQSNNLAICVGDFLKVNKKDFIEAFSKLDREEVVERMILKQKKLLDKKSKERFLKTFYKL